MVTELIKVHGMSCMHCKKAVEEAVKAIPGVGEAVVNLEAGELKVVYDETRANRQEICKAVEDAGYTV